MTKATLWLFAVIGAWASWWMWALVIPVLAQTQLAPSQVRPTIAVAEWAKCTGSGSTPDCGAIQLMRFRYADGTLSTPFYVIPTPSDFVQDARWVSQPIF